MFSYEVIIVGAGPSGSAAAIHLANLEPNLAPHVLLLDKAIFPRPKLCAGGVTADAELVLRQLGISIELPMIPVHTSKFIFAGGSLTFEHPSHFRVIRRDEFDHYLFQKARERGIVTQDGEAVERIIRTSQEVLVVTSKNEYRANILIGADGANSTVRRLLDLHRHGRLMMALEIFAPTEHVSISNFVNNMAIFDFSVASKGMPGYCWIFPSVDQHPMVSLGIIESPFGRDQSVSPKAAFGQWLIGHGLDVNEFNLRAHPALGYEAKARCSSSRVLLVGDAAGIDPLLGEGITSALALGTIAAETAFDGLQKGDFCFSNYEKRISSSAIGVLMRRRRVLAHRLYTNPILQRQEYAALLKWLHMDGSQQNSQAMFWEPASA